MTEVLLAILGSSVVATIVSKIFSLFEHKNMLYKAVRMTTFHNLNADGKGYLADGYISETEYQAYLETYQVYKGLGGDGYADNMKKLIDELYFNSLKGTQPNI